VCLIKPIEIINYKQNFLEKIVMRGFQEKKEKVSTFNVFNLYIFQLCMHGP
jgi:hypothetical protein